MNIFGIKEAEHYCSHFQGSTGDAEKSIDEFQLAHLGKTTRTLSEGTQLFREFKDCSLRDVERCLFLSASHYRRALDLMLASSSPWAYVTLYYGSWYASRALLGMFGCTIFRYHVVDVDRGRPGAQELRLRKIGNKSGQERTTYTGLHQKYWDLFYRAIQSLIPMLAPEFAASLSPVSGDPVWQITTRNSVNYDSFEAIVLAEDFSNSFTQNGFPNSLPGILHTQFQVFESLLELAFSYAYQYGLNTDTLNNLGAPAPLREKVRALVYSSKPPGLVRLSKKAAMT